MEVRRETEVDLAIATEHLAFVQGVYRLYPSELALEHPDVLRFGVVLSPWGIDELVRAHCVIVDALGGHDAAGRILFVDAAMPEPRPMWHAKRIEATAIERDLALPRIDASRRKAAAARDAHAEIRRLEDLRTTFRALAEKAMRDLDGHVRPTAGAARSPYRHPGQTLLVASLDGANLEVVSDPFPEVELRILVADEDPSTERALRELDRVEVVVADDPWHAVEALSTPDAAFDLAVVALVFPRTPDVTGAKVHRMVRAARPDLAARIVLVASGAAVAEHGDRPPSSTQARILARPVTKDALIRLIEPLVHERP